MSSSWAGRLASLFSVNPKPKTSTPATGSVSETGGRSRSREIRTLRIIMAVGIDHRASSLSFGPRTRTAPQPENGLPERSNDVNLDTASDIVRQLADGLDPTTGESFPTDSPYQRPLIIRALCVAHKALEEGQAKLRRNPILPEHAGTPWSDEEDRRLSDGFDSGTPIKELAGRHKRTTAAIQARLVKLGKLSQDESRFRV